MPRSHHSFKLQKSRRYFSFYFLFILIIVGVIVATVAQTSNLPLAAILTGLVLSLYRLIVAYLISLVIAVLLAVAVSGSKLGDTLIPFFDLMQNLPSFALIPLFVWLFGYTNTMAIIFAATSILWPILFYMIHALMTARRDWSDAATVFGAIGWKRIWYYSIPLSVPALVTGSIVGFSIGWEAIIGIEIIGLGSGIGSFLNTAIGSNRAAFSVGLGILLLIVLLLNRLVWMPLLKRSNLYGE